jgi:hypothetical protein
MRGLFPNGNTVQQSAHEVVVVIHNLARRGLRVHSFVAVRGLRADDVEQLQIPVQQDPADRLVGNLREDHVAVRIGRDGLRSAVGGRDRVLGDGAARCDPADFVGVAFREPKGTVWAAAIPCGKLFGVGFGYSVTLPLVVILPIVFRANSVNHSAPSGPAVMLNGTQSTTVCPHGVRFAVGIGNSVKLPLVVMRPIRL